MPSRKQAPRIMVGELSGRLYLVTRYRELGGGMIEALGEKVDVTNAVGGALARLDELGLELRPVEAEEPDPASRSVAAGGIGRDTRPFADPSWRRDRSGRRD